MAQDFDNMSFDLQGSMLNDSFNNSMATNGMPTRHGFIDMMPLNLIYDGNSFDMNSNNSMFYNS